MGPSLPRGGIFHQYMGTRLSAIKRLTAVSSLNMFYSGAAAQTVGSSHDLGPQNVAEEGKSPYFSEIYTHGTEKSPN